MRIKQSMFSGERPRVAKHLTRDYEAQIAENVDLSRGDLRPLKESSRIENLTATGTLKSLYRWKKSGDDEWIVHANELDFARSPIAGEEHDRVYVTGMPEPRVLSSSNLSTPFDFETDYYKLGVPAPRNPLNANPLYPGDTYRSYIYTYVVKLGSDDAEEGANSPIREIYGDFSVISIAYTPLVKVGFTRLISLAYTACTSIEYDNLTGTFDEGEVVTDGTSGATGTIHYATSGTLYLKNVTGAFAAGHAISGGTSGATATIDSTATATFTSGDTIMDEKTGAQGEWYSDDGSTLIVKAISGTFEADSVITGSSSDASAYITEQKSGTVTLTCSSLTGTFTSGETVTDGTTGATGKYYYSEDSSIILKDITGTFESTDTITGGTSGATAVINTVDTGHIDFRYGDTVTDSGTGGHGTVYANDGSNIFVKSVTGSFKYENTISAGSGVQAEVGTVISGDFAEGDTVTDKRTGATGEFQSDSGSVLVLKDVSNDFEAAEATITFTATLASTLTISYSDLSGTFTVGQTLTDNTTGATGTIYKVDDDNDILYLNSVAGTFTYENSISSATGSATIDSVATTTFTEGDTITDSDTGATGQFDSQYGYTLKMKNVSGTFSVGDTLIASPSAASVTVATAENGIEDEKYYMTASPSGASAVMDTVTEVGNSVTLSGFIEPPTGRSIGKIRIYRVAGGSSGSGDYLYVGEFDTAGVDFSTYTFTDDVEDADLGEAFAGENWVTPPEGLTGLISPDGGSLAGFYGNRVYVTEPYLPHAWPYSYPVDSEIVGLGWIGNAIVVLTDQFIYLLTGQADSMSTTKFPGRYPCLSKAGIVSCEIGVLYPSAEGIVLVTLDGPQLFSYDYFTKKQYTDNYSPSDIRAAYYNSQYFAFHNSGCFSLNIKDKTLSRISTSPIAAAPHVSLEDSQLYFISGGEEDGVNALYKFAENSNDDYMIYTYRSKDYLLPADLNFSSARVVLDVSEWGAANAANIASNAAIFASGGGQGVVNEPTVNDGEVNYDGLKKVYTGNTFRFYGDGVLLHTRSITSNDPFRLPGGVLYRRCYFEITGDLPVSEIAVATSMEELLDAA